MNAGEFWIGIGFFAVGVMSLLSLRFGWRGWWRRQPPPRTPGDTAWQQFSRLFSAWLCLAAGMYFVGDLIGIPPLFAGLIGAAFALLLLLSLPLRKLPR